MKNKRTVTAGGNDCPLGDAIADALYAQLMLALGLMGRERFLELIADVLGARLHDRQVAEPRTTKDDREND